MCLPGWIQCSLLELNVGALKTSLGKCPIGKAPNPALVPFNDVLIASALMNYSQECSILARVFEVKSKVDCRHVLEMNDIHNYGQCASFSVTVAWLHWLNNQVSSSQLLLICRSKQGPSFVVNSLPHPLMAPLSYTTHGTRRFLVSWWAALLFSRWCVEFVAQLPRNSYF